MDKMFNFLSLACGFLGGLCVQILGAWDELLYVLVALMIIDYITGVIKGVYHKQLSSNTGFKGIMKKIMVLAVVAVANLIQIITGDSIAIREIVIMFFICNEGISILENAAELYPNMPVRLKDVLLQLREDKSNDEELK